MTSPQRIRRARTFAVVLGIVTLAIVTFAPGVVAPGSHVNAQVQEICLLTGQARFTRYYLWMPVGRRVHETHLSAALSYRTLPAVNHRWVTVNFAQPGYDPPPSPYSRAYWQTRQLKETWSEYGFSRDACIRTSNQLLEVWREGGSDAPADTYLILLEHLALTADANHVTVAQLPRRLVTQSLTHHHREPR